MADILRSSSPADANDEIGRFEIADDAAVDAAVARARRAFPAWRALGVEARAALLRRFRDVARAKSEELAQLIAREMGKALWDARGEASLIASKVDVTLEQGLRFVETLDTGAGARASFQPRGVLAVRGPFDFPAHLPNGHIVPALATGNCVVFKPSDLAPAVGAWLASALAEAGLPSGVFQVVQGRADTGRALALHTDVNGVLFTGSYAVGRALEQATLDQPGKLLALEMGGKNGMIVWEDADVRLAVAEAAVSIAATTGQRCSSLSRLFVHRARAEEFCERLVRVLRALRIGAPLEDGVFMGPLVSRGAFEKIARMRALAGEAGAERLVGGECELGAPWTGAGLVRFGSLAQRHPYQRDEMFGPEAALYEVDDLDQAIAALNDSDYGLAASVMTADRSRYEHCIGRIETGILNWNRGTIGASGRLPFGGGKKSGNDRPAGILAAVYCTTPQAHLEHAGGFDPKTLPPGVPEA